MSAVLDQPITESINLTDTERQAFVALAESALTIASRADFLAWTSGLLQNLFPHGMLICGLGQIGGPSSVPTFFRGGRAVDRHPAAEEALYDSAAMRRLAARFARSKLRFVGIDLGREPAPDETTILRFRHLLEKHQLGKKLFEEVNRHLAACGLKVARGTIVDATLIAAPSSTKNKVKSRDPEMHQTKKDKQWHFVRCAHPKAAPWDRHGVASCAGHGPAGGMKAHVGVDSQTKLIHSVVATAVHVADAKVLPALLHGQETKVWGDAAYQGQRRVIEKCAPKAKDLTQRRCRFKGRLVERERAKNKTKSRVRAKVEHVFGVIKNLFGFVKVRYKGVMKNANRLFVTCALANLFIVRHRLLRTSGARRADLESISRVSLERPPGALPLQKPG